MMLLLMMMMMMGTIVNAADDVMTMMMVVEMKRVLRDLVKMRKLRTFPRKESCNVFSSIKFEQQILNS